jgi:RNA polymerase sigma-70 factor (ECF subfamily)
MQQAADRTAVFERLVGEYEPALRRLAGCYEADSSAREDLFQDIALALWRAIPNFRGDSSERTWLYRIAHNVAISSAQSRRKRARREVSEEFTATRPAPEAGPHELTVDRQKRAQMIAAIRELPELDRQVISLHLEGMDYDEIEQVSGLTRSAIATRLTRIRQRLTEAVRGQEARNESSR